MAAQHSLQVPDGACFIIKYQLGLNYFTNQNLTKRNSYYVLSYIILTVEEEGCLEK